MQLGLARADKLDGGPGLDTARFDRRLDAPAAVKNLLP
jgi:hypothetical protein